MNRLTHLDLFSGIGGFALACRWCGIETIGFSEIDPYCCRVLEKNFPGVPNYGDIRNVPAVECDLITGGFPCQPFSCAGKRRGTADDRYLWPSMLAVIERCRPAWVLGENVPGIANMVLDRVQSDLAEIGYESQSLIIPACAVDARHRRDRVWIVAHCTSIRPSGKNDNGEYPEPHKEIRLSLKPGRSSCGETLANPTSQRVNGKCRDTADQAGERNKGESESDGGSTALPDANSTGKASGRNDCGMGREGQPDEKSRNNGPSRWLPEPAICRVAHGIPHRVDRLRGLGNAIVPQIAAEILKAMISLSPQP